MQQIPRLRPTTGCGDGRMDESHETDMLASFDFKPKSCINGDGLAVRVLVASAGRPRPRRDHVVERRGSRGLERVRRKPTTTATANLLKNKRWSMWQKCFVSQMPQQRLRKLDAHRLCPPTMLALLFIASLILGCETHKPIPPLPSLCTPTFASALASAARPAPAPADPNELWIFLSFCNRHVGIIYAI